MIDDRKLLYAKSTFIVFVTSLVQSSSIEPKHLV